MSDVSLHIAVRSPKEFWASFRTFVASFSDEVALGAASLTNQNLWEEDKKSNLDYCVNVLESVNFRFIRQVSVVVSTPKTQANPARFTFRPSNWNGAATPIEFNSQHGVLLSHLQHLESAFEVLTPQQAVASTAEPLVNAELTAHRSAVESLESQTAKLGRIQAESIAKCSEFITKATVELAESRRRAEDEFASYKRAREEEFRDQFAELERQRLELDRSESRGVRRQLLTQMEKLIEKQASFERSTETRQSDIWVRIVCLIFAGGGAALAVSALLYVWNNGNPGPLFYAPFATGSVLLASTAIVLTRHEVIRSRRNSDTDLAIMQYSRDMYRMSWIAEVIFEAYAENREGRPVEIPAQVLEQFSRALFEPLREGTHAHPLDELARFARKFRKANIGSNGITLERSEPPRP